MIDEAAPSGSLAECVGAVATSVSPRLISPTAFSTMAAVARLLPGSLAINTFGFECRLADDRALADFMVLVTSSSGRDSLAGTDPTSSLSARLSTDPIWRRVQTLAARWADPTSGLEPAVAGLWLEFDLDGPPIGIPRPSAFLSLLPYGRDDDSDAGAGDLDVDGYLTIVATMKRVLAGCDLSPRTAETLARCIRALSPYEYVFDVGLMVPRGAEAVRLCIRLRSTERTIEYLADVGWPGTEHDLRGILELARLVDFTWLVLDVDETVQPKIGLECYFHGHEQPEREPRWGVLLAALVREGLCTADKREALLSYPGHTGEHAPDVSWPPALRRASDLLGERWLSTLVRTLHHVKLVHRPGEPMEAKAYLAAHHHWHRLQG